MQEKSAAFCAEKHPEKHPKAYPTFSRGARSLDCGETGDAARCDAPTPTQTQSCCVKWRHTRHCETMSR